MKPAIVAHGLSIVFVLAMALAGSSGPSARAALPAAGTAVIAPESYEGALMLASDVDDQTSRAGLVVVGTVTGLKSRTAQGGIVTDVTISVEHALKGRAGKALTFTIQGGQVGSKRLIVAGVPNFLTSERVLLFLRGENDLHLVQLWESKYSLAGRNAVQLESHSTLAISDIETRMSNRLRKPVSIGSQDAVVSTPQAFTLSCPAWPSSVLPVAFQVNGANPGSGGASGTEFARLAYSSWHNWQALSDSYPSFSFNGMTSSAQAQDFVTTVSWADLDSFGTGVLGINWCVTDQNATTRFEGDTLIDNTGFTWDND